MIYNNNISAGVNLLRSWPTAVASCDIDPPINTPTSVHRPPLAHLTHSLLRRKYMALSNTYLLSTHKCVGCLICAHFITFHSQCNSLNCLVTISVVKNSSLEIYIYKLYSVN